MGLLSWVESKTKKLVAGGIGTSPLTKFGFWRREIEGIKKSDRYNERIIGKARYTNVINTVLEVEKSAIIASTIKAAGPKALAATEARGAFDLFNSEISQMKLKYS